MQEFTQDSIFAKVNYNFEEQDKRATLQPTYCITEKKITHHVLGNLSNTLLHNMNQNLYIVLFPNMNIKLCLDLEPRPAKFAGLDNSLDVDV